MKMRLSRLTAEAMIGHARAESPHECCGLLVGTSDEILDAVRARNIAEFPERRYVIEPRDHFRAICDSRSRGLDVLGAYHSHPRSAAVPSATDAAEGFSDFLFVIVGLAAEPPEITAWTWTDGNFTAVSLVRV